MSKFRYKAVVIKYKKVHKDGSLEEKSTVILCLYDEETRRESEPLPISIVAKAWPSVKVQPLYSYMTRFARFLTYAFFEYETPAQTIADINPDTVLAFLTDISTTSGRSYVEAAEIAVTRGLYYLCKHGIAPGLSESDFAFSTSRRGTSIYLKDVKDCYTRPPVRRQKKLHDMDIHVVIRMLDLAMRHTPRIALGVYLECFGGVRYAEVVSLSKDRFHFNPDHKANPLYVDIEDADHRPELRRGFLSKAKKPRSQGIIYIPELFNPIYEQYRRLTATASSDALMINAYGRAMTESSYSKYFGKLKGKLIESLKNDPDFGVRNYALYLESADWGTHICRGIFSNMIAGVAKTSAEIALARGDSSQDSSLPYLTDQRAVREQITEVVREIIRETHMQAGEQDD